MNARGLGVALVAAFCVTASARAQGEAPDTTVADTARAVPAPSKTLPVGRAPADTGLGGFLRGLADSTDVYFGPSSTPIDTVGLDSTLAFRLANPDPLGDMRRARPSWAPWFTFNRADGPLYGGVLTLGRPERLGAVSGRLGYAAGPNDWLGGGSYRKRWVTAHEGRAAELRRRRRGETAWTFDLSAGRYSQILDPEHSVSWQRVLRALVDVGTDSARRNGAEKALPRSESDAKSSAGVAAA